MKAKIRHELLSKLYSLSPSSMRNMFFTLYGFKLKHERYGKDFYRILNWLKATEFWNKSKIEEYQVTRMRYIINYAYNNVPYYSRIMKRKKLVPGDFKYLEDLKKLPLLKKDVVKKNPQEFKSRNISKFYTNYTSGTTGSPMKIYLSPYALKFQWAVWWRHKSRFGLKPGDKHLVIGARLPETKKTNKNKICAIDKANNRYYLSMYDISMKNIESIVSLLNKVDFKFYTGYPSAFYSLAKFIKEKNLAITNPPKIIVCGADNLTPMFEKYIANVFGTEVTDQYGSAEACGNFSRCEYGKYHLDFELGIVELLPINGIDNANTRKIVFTGLINEAMPLIRYDIGDYALISDDVCSCGRESLHLDSIEGRTEDFIKTPDGRLVSGLNQVFEWSDGIDGAQVIQETENKIKVLFKPNKNFSEYDIKKIDNELRRRLGNNIAIDYEKTNEFIKTKSGKQRLVISKIEASNEFEKDLKERL